MTASVLVLMGVSGSGKTTIGEAVATRLGWPFLEGDALHPAANVAKMSGGTPLTDEDRWPWLDAIRAWIDARVTDGTHGVVACSALRRGYRERLGIGRNGVSVVVLHADRALLIARLAARKGHFMPVTLLDSQLATLEMPDADEHAIVVDIGGTPESVVDAVMRKLNSAR